MVIFTSPDTSKQEDFAAKEVRRYIDQRTGQLIPGFLPVEDFWS